MSINRIFNLGLLVMTVAVGAAHAGVQAEFHLPFGARWGQMTLAPGDYKLTLPEMALGHRQFTVTSNDRTGYVQPMVADYGQSLEGDSGHSYLKLVKVNGTYFVAEYRSGVTGKTFNFAVPKQKHNLEMTDQDVTKVEVSGN
jgi:hypothetical protein